ncbi:MAG: cyclic nucleotide-binding domain-containing protein [Myxococcota bacterium]
MVTLLEFQPGEVIIRQRDYGDTAYTIVSGKVCVTNVSEGETIDLGFLGPGEIFGEMGMIDDRPRSATVTATEATTVREIHREAFVESLQTHPEIAMTLLSAIFERLRQAHTTIAQLQAAGDKPRIDSPRAALRPSKTRISITNCRVWLEGITNHAMKSLPENPFEISRFPFRIGRQTSDPLAHNDLALADEEPLQISRHHVELVTNSDDIGVVDRGSRLGAQVDGEQLGGFEGYPGPI